MELNLLLILVIVKWKLIILGFGRDALKTDPISQANANQGSGRAGHIQVPVNFSGK